jgi:hypothetical protein
MSKGQPMDLDVETVQLIRQMLHRGPSGADDVTKQRYHDVIDTFCDSVADLLRMIELASQDEDEDEA